MTEHPSDIVTQGVGSHVARFQESWAFRDLDPPALSHDLDALDAAVEFWLDVQEGEAARRAAVLS